MNNNFALIIMLFITLVQFSLYAGIGLFINNIFFHWEGSQLMGFLIILSAVLHTIFSSFMAELNSKIE